MARLRGEPEPTDHGADVPEVEAISRSNLLPDIKEIDASIATEEEKAQSDASARDGSRVATVPAGGGGFRRGLKLAISLAIVATALYIFAPQLTNTVPALAGPLGAYVDAVDQGRAMLNEQLGGVVGQLKALAGG